jgi:hypothetical protein
MSRQAFVASVVKLVGLDVCKETGLADRRPHFVVRSLAPGYHCRRYEIQGISKRALQWHYKCYCVQTVAELNDG